MAIFHDPLRAKLHRKSDINKMLISSRNQTKYSMKDHHQYSQSHKTRPSAVSLLSGFIFSPKRTEFMSIEHSAHFPNWNPENQNLWPNANAFSTHSEHDFF